MQTPVKINRRYSYLFGILIFSFCFYIFLLGFHDLSIHIFWHDYFKNTSHPSKVVDDVFNFLPIDSHALRALCETTEWNPEIVFTCDNSYGGLGNIRNSILNCMRYAISAGASMVVPRILVRDPKDLSYLETGERASLDYMFDMPHFFDSLELSCPQLMLHRYVDNVPNRAHASGPVALLPESVVPGSIPKDGLEHPEAWRGQFFKWLEGGSGLATPTMQTPVLIDLGRSYLQYPIYSDGEEIAVSFGGILKFRKDVRILATTVLRNMLSTYNMSRDIVQPILRDTFFGAHLRTEIDAVRAWPAKDWVYQRYEVQSSHYLTKLAATNLTLIYLASGNQTEVAKFSRDAAAYNLTTKFMLLDAKDTEYLNSLTWDQQGLVDFLVMTKGSSFIGIGHSSFAWNVALKRHIFSEIKSGYLDGVQLLSDELSEIVGKPYSYPEYAACLWP